MQAREFLRRLFSHWISGMTGALSLPFTIAAAWAPQFPQRLAFTLLAAICVGAAAFRVWQAEYQSVRKLEEDFALTRPFVVPELQIREEPGGREQVSVVLMNIGARVALSATLDRVGSDDRAVVFHQIQTLRPEDGRVEIPMRFIGANNLRDVLATIAMAATIQSQREGRGPIDSDFAIPVTVKYSDASGRVYSDRRYGFTWVHSPTRVPLDTQLLIGRVREAPEA